MNIISVLNSLLDLELRMERLYRHFESLFVFDDNAVRMFHELSTEERSHADMIRYQLRIVRNNLDIFSDIQFDNEPLTKLGNEIKAMITAVRPPTLHEAVLFSIRAERSAAELHMNSVVARSNPEMGEHIRKLVSYDDAHDRQLTEYAKKIGIDTSRT